MGDVILLAINLANFEFGTFINDKDTSVVTVPNDFRLNLDIQVIHCNMFFHTGRFKEAAKSGQEAAKHLPDDPTLFYNLGSLYGKRNFYKVS